MSVMTIRSLGIDRMSIDERLRLVEEIWDSISAEAKPVDLMPDWLPALIDERIAAHEANPTGGVSWEKAQSLIRDSLKATDQ